MKKQKLACLIVITLLFSVQTIFATDNLPLNTEDNSSNEVSYDCSAGIFMKGAVTGPQTIPKTNKIVGGDISQGPFGLSPLMQKPVYDLIYNALRNYSLDKVYIDAYHIKDTQLYQYFCSVLNDHPELFYVNTTITYNVGPEIQYVYFTYVYPREQAEQMLDTYNNRVNYILSNAVSPEMTTVEKILAVHDYLLLNCEYDYENLLNNTVPNDSGTAYGIIVKHIGVCQSYTLAFSDLLNRLGIPCINIGSVPMNHVWNLVLINNNWYHIDTTWDDALFTGNPNRYDFRGYVKHTYFLITDSTISDADHQHTGWDATLFPASTDKTYENLWIKNASTGAIWYNGKFYLGYAGSIYSFDLENDKYELLFDTGNNARNYIAKWGNWLYYTSGNLGTVNRINLDNKTVEPIDTFNVDDLYINDGKLIYSDWETDNIKEKPLAELNPEQCLIGYPLFTDESGNFLTLNEIPQNSTVNVKLSVSDLSEYSQPSYLIFAFYDDNKLVAFSKCSENISGIEGTYSCSITTPAVSFNQVKLFLWDINDLKPYAISLKLNKS